MKITLDEARRIARLAHLQYADQELEVLRGQLDQILRFVDKLKELDTEGVEPAVGITGSTESQPQTLRDDALAPTLSRDDALEGAPDSGEGHFRVPRILT